MEGFAFITFNKYGTGNTLYKQQRQHQQQPQQAQSLFNNLISQLLQHNQYKSFNDFAIPVSFQFNDILIVKLCDFTEIECEDIKVCTCDSLSFISSLESLESIVVVSVFVSNTFLSSASNILVLFVLQIYLQNIKKIENNTNSKQRAKENNNEPNVSCPSSGGSPNQLSIEITNNNNYNDQPQYDPLKFQSFQFLPFSEEEIKDFFIIAPLLLIDQWDEN